MSMYLYAGQMIFPFPVRHIILDAVQILKTQVNFLRGVVSRTKGQLDDWFNGTMTDIHQAHELDPTDVEAWPQNPSACGYFRGCEFREVCSADPKLRAAYLKEGFKRDEK